MERKTPSKFSHNAQSWQHWHFCTTSNVNTLKTREYQISFKSNLHLLWCFGLKLKLLISPSHLVSSNTKMSTLSTLCVTGKLECNFSRTIRT